MDSAFARSARLCSPHLLASPQPARKQTPSAEVFCELSLFCVDGDSVYFYFIVDGDDEAFSAVDDLNIDKI